MSMSLRDQLLQAGLVTAKQAKDAERQQQRQQQQRQQQPRHKRDAVSQPQPALAPRQPQAAKVARDLELNRKQQEKAEKKARWAQIKQLVEQNRLPKLETEEFYNFVDGNKIRRIWADASIRERLGRGEISIVRHDGRYDVVPAAIAARIRERDERAVIACGAAQEKAHSDEAYKEFSVPDDLIW